MDFSLQIVAPVKKEGTPVSCIALLNAIPLPA